MTPIYYGAGIYAAENLDRILFEGIYPLPVCFADADVNKHGTKIGEYDILSLQEAIARYPDYHLYLTLARWNLYSATEQLRESGIPQERIKYIEPVEYRLGCDKHSFSIVTKGYSMCYFADLLTPRDSSGCIKTDIGEWVEHYNNLRENLRLGKATECDTCPYLKYGIYDIEPNWRMVNLCPDSKRDVCNFKCIYCLVSDIERADEQDFPYKTLPNMFSQLIEYNDKEKYEITLAKGEPTLRSDFDEGLNLIKSHASGIFINTNGSVYKDSISQAVREGNDVRICVSLDAGTAETFAKIKGVDCFSKVVENLKRYAEAGVFIWLKYIILEGYNDNEKDLDGFVEIAKEVNALVALDKNNFPKRQSRMTDGERKWLSLLAEKVTKNSLDYYVFGYDTHFADEDREYLENIRNQIV